MGIMTPIGEVSKLGYMGMSKSQTKKAMGIQKRKDRKIVICMSTNKGEEDREKQTAMNFGANTP